MWTECTRASRAAFCCAALRLFRAVCVYVCMYVFMCLSVSAVPCNTVRHALGVMTSFYGTGVAECMIARESTTYLSRMRSTYTREVGRGGWRSPEN